MRNLYLIVISLMIQIPVCLGSISIIEGKIQNYNANTGDTIISVCNTLHGLNGQICKDVLIKNTGEFKAEIEHYRTTEIVILFDQNYIRLPLKPSQKNYVEIDAFEFRKDLRIPRNIKTEGDNKETYNILLDYRPKWLEKFFYHRFIENSIMLHELDYKKYYDYKTRYLKDQSEYLEEYIKLNEIKDAFFIDWARSKIIYDYGYYMHLFHSLRPNPLIDPIPEWYLDSIEQLVPFNERGATNSGYYENYLNLKKIQLSRVFENSEEGRRLIDNNKNVWEEKMKYLIDHSDGLSKDIMLGKLMDEYLEKGQTKGVEKYLNEIVDESIKNLIKSRIKELEIDN